MDLRLQGVSTGPSDSSGLDTVIEPGVDALDWAVAVAVVVGGYVVGRVARMAVERAFRRYGAEDSFAPRLVGRFVQWTVFLMGVGIAGARVGLRVGPLVGALGLGGLALALALQPTLQNFFAGVVLHAQRPARVGDEIRTGEYEGHVVDIRSRSVVLRTYDGERVFIPNSTVLDREIVNHVREGRRRTTVRVGVAYGTHLPTAQQVLMDAARSVGGVREQPPVRVYAVAFADSSVEFDVDVWHAPDEASRRRVRGELVTAAHAALGDAGITIPFPQRTVWLPERS